MVGPNWPARGVRSDLPGPPEGASVSSGSDSQNLHPHRPSFCISKAHRIPHNDRRSAPFPDVLTPHPGIPSRIETLRRQAGCLPRCLGPTGGRLSNGRVPPSGLHTVAPNRMV